MFQKEVVCALEQLELKLENIEQLQDIFSLTLMSFFQLFGTFQYDVGQISAQFTIVLHF